LSGFSVGRSSSNKSGPAPDKVDTFQTNKFNLPQSYSVYTALYKNIATRGRAFLQESVYVHDHAVRVSDQTSATKLVSQLLLASTEERPTLLKSASFYILAGTLKESIIYYIIANSILSDAHLRNLAWALDFLPGPAPEPQAEAAIPDSTEWIFTAQQSADARIQLIKRRLSILLDTVSKIKSEKAIYPVAIKNETLVTEGIRFLSNYHRSNIANKKIDLLVITHLYVFVDAHMPLLNVIAKQTDNPFDNVAPEVFNSISPNVSFALQPETMPLMHHFFMIAIACPYNEVNNERLIRKQFPYMDNKDFLLLASFVQLIHKIIPNRSNIRRPQRFISARMNKYPEFAETVLKMLVVSLLGAYPTAIRHAPLAARLACYQLFYEKHNAATLSSMVNAYEAKNLIAVGREHLLWVLSKMTGVGQVYSKLYDMDAFTALACFHAETIRAKFAVTMKPFHVRVDNTLIHVMMAESQVKKTVAGRLADMMEKCRTINYINYKLPQNINITPGIYYTLPSPHVTLPPDEMDIMRKVVRRLTPAGIDFPVNFDWLLCFGISEETLDRFHVVMFSKKTMFYKFMLNLPSRDYIILHSFLSACEEKNSICMVSSDSLMYLAHVASVIESMEIRDGDVAPPVLGKMHVCNNCRNVKNTSVFHNGGGIQYFGGRASTVIDATGKVTCACKQPAPNWRETYFITNNEHPPSRSGAQVVTRTNIISEKKKLSKTIAGKISQSKCQQTETQLFDMLGKMIIYDGVAYVGCMDDFKIIRLDSAMYCGNRVLCHHCYIRRMLESSSGGFGTRTGDVSGGNLVLAKRSEAGLVTLARNVAKKIENVCEYCQKIIPVDKRLSFMLVDDSQEDETQLNLRNMHFCSAHGSLWWIVQGEYTHRSAVIDAISSQQYMSLKHSNKSRKRSISDVADVK
jgi:hypothetical protein